MESSNGKIMSLFSLTKYLLSAFFVPGTVQTIGDVVVYSRDQMPAFLELGDRAASGTGVIAKESSIRGGVESDSVPF